VTTKRPSEDHDAPTVAEEMARVNWDYTPNDDDSSGVAAATFFQNFPWEGAGHRTPPEPESGGG